MGVWRFERPISRVFLLMGRSHLTERFYYIVNCSGYYFDVPDVQKVDPRHVALSTLSNHFAHESLT